MPLSTAPATSPVTTPPHPDITEAEHSGFRKCGAPTMVVVGQNDSYGSDSDGRGRWVPTRKGVASRPITGQRGFEVCRRCEGPP